MKCEECDKLLAVRLTGDLDPDERDSLDVHLGLCSVCAARAAEYDRIHRDLSTLARVYNGIEPGFQFEPAEVLEVVRITPGRLVRVARVSLAMAAMIACALALREAFMPATPPAEPTAPTAGSSKLARIYRTAPLWIPKSFSTAARPPGVRRVPTLMPTTRSAGPASSIVRMKTPTLITTRRRSTHVGKSEKPQSRRERGHLDPGDRTGMGLRGRRCAAA